MRANYNLQRRGHWGRPPQQHTCTIVSPRQSGKAALFWCRTHLMALLQMDVEHQLPWKSVHIVAASPTMAFRSGVPHSTYRDACTGDCIPSFGSTCLMMLRFSSSISGISRLQTTDSTDRWDRLVQGLCLSALLPHPLQGSARCELQARLTDWQHRPVGPFGPRSMPV